MTRIYQLEVCKHKQARLSPKDHKLDELFVFEQKVLYVKCINTIYIKYEIVKTTFKYFNSNFIPIVNKQNNIGKKEKNIKKNITNRYFTIAY